MLAPSLSLILAANLLACRNAPAAEVPQIDADQPLVMVACDPDEDWIDGESRCIQGADCLEVLERGRSVGTGGYLIDPDGVDQGDAPLEVVCDMDTDGGGWTVFNDGHLFERGWVDFEHVAGEGSPRMEWVSPEAFLLAPEGARGCATMALRATAWLPVTFTEIAGSWLASGATPESQHDDFHHGLRWGEVTDDCRGHLKFGTDQDTLKQGGEWGMHWTGREEKARSFGWYAESVATSSVVRWELMDQGSPEDIVFSEIQLIVR